MLPLCPREPNSRLPLINSPIVSLNHSTHQTPVTKMSSSYGAVGASRNTLPGDDEEKRDSNELTGLIKNHSVVVAVPESSVGRKAMTAVLLCVLIVSVVLMADFLETSQATVKSIYMSSEATASSGDLIVSSISNEYGIRGADTMLPYPFLTGALFMEPYKEATITLEGPLSGCTYDWSLTNVKGTADTVSGVSKDGIIMATLESVGEYLLTASESCGAASDSSRQLSMKVWVKYVRRELQSLNDQDREDFLDAFHTLWTVSTTKGQALYGDRYKSVNYFATLHNDGGGNDACDEFHGGYGFLNNHMYLSAYLEQSLQLVNPRVALHYMEYGKYFESAAYTQRKSRQRIYYASYQKLSH